MIKNKNKSNSLLKYIFFIFILIVLVLLAGLAYARYQAVLQGGTNTQVAEWHFDLKNKDRQSITVEGINFPMTRTDGNKSVEKDKLAPGTSGEFKMIVDTKNTQVLMIYNIKINLIDCPTNLKFYIDSDMKQELPKVEIGEKQENGQTVKIHQLSISRFLSLDEVNGEHLETLYWRWPMETGNTEEQKYENNLEDSKWIDKEKMTMDIWAIGEQVLEAPSQIAIRSINVENSNGSTSTATINKATTELADGINANIVLGSDNFATSTINVTMTNLSDKAYYFYDAQLLSVLGEEIDSDSIDYEIIGLTESRNTTLGTKLIPGSTVNFKIIFRYKNTVIPNINNNTLGGNIDLELRKAYSITYENFEDSSNYPKEVIDGGTLELQFADYIGLKVKSNGKLLLLDSAYTYNNNLFHIENVGYDLEITKILVYPGVKNGLTSFAIRENSSNLNFGYYSSYKDSNLKYNEDSSLDLDGNMMVYTPVEKSDFNSTYSINITVKGNTVQNDRFSTATIIAISDSVQGNTYVNFVGFNTNYLICYAFYAGQTIPVEERFKNQIGYGVYDISKYSDKIVNIQITSIKNGETKLYINGRLASTFQSGNSNVQFDSINIGDLRPGRGLNFVGNIYDVATYNKVLTDNEITENWIKAKERYNIEEVE